VTAKKNGLGKAEMIRDVILTPEEWCVRAMRGVLMCRSPDNQMLTPAMKLNRPLISKQYEAQIKVGRV
jgi:long-subunit acyl-CoA synthetase (AMP-forming)